MTPTISVIDDVKSLQRLSEEWRDLAAASPAQWIYADPEWALAWLDVYGYKCKLIAITARVGGKLIGLVPFVLRRGEFQDAFLHRVEPASGVSSDYFLPSIHPEYEYVLDLILDELVGKLGKKWLLVLPNMPVGSSLLAKIKAYCEANQWPVTIANGVCPRLALPATYVEAERKWTKALKADVRRQRNRLSKHGKLSLEIVTQRENAMTWLEEFFVVYSQKWSAERKPNRFASELKMSHYRQLTDRLFGKGLHISSLTLDGERIAYHFGFLSHGWLGWYTPTYKKEYAAYSPSKVHASFLMDLGCVQGWKGFDLLQGAEPYKRGWTTDSLSTETLMVGMGGRGISYYWQANCVPFGRKKLRKPYERLMCMFQKIAKKPE